MKRLLVTGCALAALAACQPQIPDSAAGVGFDNAVNSPEARARREAQLRGDALPEAQAVSQETIPEAPQVESGPLSALQPAAQPESTTAVAPASDAAAIAQETQAALAASSVNSGSEPLQASPSNPEPEVFSNPGISDENNFDAVEDRRSIEDDAARQARNRENYEVVEPTAVPRRTGDTGPNIVAYALSTSNPMGARQYQRLGINAAARYERNCAKYPSADLAQIAFLDNGGPQNDRLGLDPDGDGYACDWDPTPFRKAAGN